MVKQIARERREVIILHENLWIAWVRIRIEKPGESSASLMSEVFINLSLGE